MKMRQGWLILLSCMMALILLMSVFAQVESEEESGRKVFNPDSTVSDGDFSGKKPTLFNKIIDYIQNRKVLSFTNVAVNSQTCYANGEHGGYIKLTDDVFENKVTQFPGCDSNYVSIYACDENNPLTCELLFNDLWDKSDNDRFEFNDGDWWYGDLDSLISWLEGHLGYPIIDGDVYITYLCYDCYASVAETSYTCYNGDWRGEPSTEYEGISGICPSEECKESSITASITNEDTIESYICEELVEGCTDPLAENFDADADILDPSVCYYKGCLDSLAVNFDADADIHDSSLCNYSSDDVEDTDAEETSSPTVEESGTPTEEQNKEIPTSKYVTTWLRQGSGCAEELSVDEKYSSEEECLAAEFSDEETGSEETTVGDEETSTEESTSEESTSEEEESTTTKGLISSFTSKSSDSDSTASSSDESSSENSQTSGSQNGQLAIVIVLIAGVTSFVWFRSRKKKR